MRERVLYYHGEAPDEIGVPVRTALSFWKDYLQFLESYSRLFVAEEKAKLISKSRSHIRFMNDCRNVAFACGNYHWYCHEAAFGKYYIRL